MELIQPKSKVDKNATSKDKYLTKGTICTKTPEQEEKLGINVLYLYLLYMYNDIDSGLNISTFIPQFGNEIFNIKWYYRKWLL